MQRVIERNVPTLREVKIPEQKFDAILCADLHLRDDCPVCREPEEFFTAQRRKLTFIRKLCEQNNCPLLCAGDLFDHWKPSPSLLSMALELLPVPTLVAPGQHDLQNHDLGSLWRTGLGTLQAGRVCFPLYSSTEKRSEGYKPIYISVGGVYGLAYGQGILDLPKIAPEKGRRTILLWHHLTCMDKQPWPDAGATAAHSLLKKLPMFDLVVTGDNHQQFCSGSGTGPKLVNPGSMMRQTADQAEFEPAVFGWVEKTNGVERIPLPIMTGVVRTGHLGKEKREDRSARMEAYIKQATKQYESRLSFSKNLEQFFKHNEEPEGVRKSVWAALD